MFNRGKRMPDTDRALKIKLAESYNNNATLRDRHEMEEWKRGRLELFAAQFPNRSVKVLDLGAGAGQAGEYLQRQGFEVVCADLSPAMVEACRRRGLNAEEQDFYSLTFEENSFDAVWSMNALLHVPKASLNVVLAGIKRVLRPGGLFCLGLYGGPDSEGVWENDPYEPKRFFSFYSHASIREMMQEYFEIMHFEVVPLAGDGLDFQSMILRKNSQTRKDR